MNSTITTKPRKQRMTHLASRTVSSIGFVSYGISKIVPRPQPVSTNCKDGCGGQCLSGCKDQCITVSK